jgi:hypothetical protein
VIYRFQTVLLKMSNLVNHICGSDRGEMKEKF